SSGSFKARKELGKRVMKHLQKPWSFCVLVLVFLVTGTNPGYSQQSSGSIRGEVKDVQGAVISGAKVHLTDVNQGDTRDVVTNQEGVFFFNPLKPSVYRLVVEAPGFKKYEVKEIRVSANDRLDVPPIELAVGQLVESVVVSDTAVLL